MSQPNNAIPLRNFFKKHLKINSNLIDFQGIDRQPALFLLEGVCIFHWEDFFNQSIDNFKSAGASNEIIEELISIAKKTVKSKNRDAAKSHTVRNIGPYFYNGEIYNDIIELSTKTGVGKNALYKRIERTGQISNKTTTQKEDAPSCNSRALKRSIFANGAEYTSKAAACRALGIEYVTFNKRRRRGLSIEQALGIDPTLDKRTKKTGMRKAPKKTTAKKIDLTVFGKTYKTYSDLARAYGLKTHVIRQRITKYGFTPEESVATKGKGCKITLNGVLYKTKSDAAKAHGLTLEALLSRQSNGWSIEEALGLCPRSIWQVEFHGKKYDNLLSLANSEKIPFHLLEGRLIRGMSIDDAIKAGPNKITNDGRINQTTLDRNPTLAAGPGTVYFFSFKKEGKKLHKIGITSRSTHERIRNERLDDVVILYELSGTLRCAYNTEKFLHKIFNRYRSGIDLRADLNGHTEVFEFDDQMAFEIPPIMKIIFENKASIDTLLATEPINWD